MSGPLSRDGVDTHRLSRHLAAAGLSDRLSVHVELISGGKSNLTYRVSDNSDRWILRRPPLGEVMSGTHDVSREHRLITALSGSTVPVPTPVLLCTDSAVLGAPFYLMEEVDGLVLRAPKDAAAIPKPALRAIGDDLVDVLADLHDLDPASVGLENLGRPQGYLQRQLERWIRQLGVIASRELDHADDVGRALGSAIPASARTSIVHGDYRLDNVLIGRTSPKVVSVLDWEMATLGDPLADLALFITFWDEPGQPFNPITRGMMAVDGFRSRTGALQRYAARHDIDVSNLDWYLAFSQFKVAVILEQIYARYRSGQTVGEDFSDVADMVPQLLQAAMDTVRSSRGFTLT
jgi:aminoglycoside phosphotransferase (APT) family kinase protein